MLAVNQGPLHGAQPQTREQARPRAKERPRLSLRDRVSTCLCIALSVGTIWFIASQGAKIDRINYNVDHMQVQIKQTQAENQTLASQVDELMRPSRILGIAVGQLHMQYANPVQIPGKTH